MKVSKCGVMRDEKMVGDGDKDTDEHLTEECVGGGGVKSTPAKRSEERGPI